MKAITCKDVGKSFTNTRVLENVTLELEENRIYALLGRNGAGKTTLMNLLCTRYLPDSGEIFLLEEPAYENEKVLSEICYMPDYVELFSTHRIKSILRYASCFYPKWNTALMHALLEQFQIDPKKLYEQLSKGQRTLISIIIGLCCGCKIVLFDEIYSGLDAVARQEFYELFMEEQEKNPRTFLFSTHLIEEMSNLFTDVIILDKGQILLSESAETLHEKSFCITGRTENASVLAGKNILSHKELGTMAEYIVYDTLDEAERAKIQAADMTLSSVPLQDFFIACTMHEHFF